MDNKKIILKLIITTFYLLMSILTSYLIFNYFLSTSVSVNGERIEPISLTILYSIGLSAVSVFMYGILALFMNFVFVKLIFSDEIKVAALTLLKYRKEQNNKQINS